MSNWLPGWWSSELSKWQEYPTEALEPDHPFHGQDNEDQYAAEFFFHNKKHGTYLEMGGYDGLTFTNTLYLNKALGWRGMLIEASPQQVRLICASFDLMWHHRGQASESAGKDYHHPRSLAAQLWASTQASN